MSGAGGPQNLMTPAQLSHVIDIAIDDAYRPLMILLGGYFAYMFSKMNAKLHIANEQRHTNTKRIEALEAQTNGETQERESGSD